MKLTELQDRILRLCSSVPRDFKQIVRNCESFQLQTIRNNLSDLCLMEYLTKSRHGNVVSYFTSDMGREALSGVMIVPAIKRCEKPEQISLEVFAR